MQVIHLYANIACTAWIFELNWEQFVCKKSGLIEKRYLKDFKRTAEM